MLNCDNQSMEEKSSSRAEDVTCDSAEPLSEKNKEKFITLSNFYNQLDKVSVMLHIEW
jgi:hypothetical protein